MDNDINIASESQLIDGSNDWNHKKNKNLELSEVYKRLGIENKAFKIKNCGTYLEFKRFKKDNEFKLYNANFCKQRLCPMCSWRRSKKIFGQVSKIMETLTREKTYRFIFLTLTQKNVEGKKLNDELDKIFKAWNSFTKRKQFKHSVVGWFRALEITHNVDEQSENYDTYHPHFHVILMVEQSYFTDKEKYISKKLMMQLWRSALKIDYDPTVFIETVKNKKGKGIAGVVAEVAKYTVKEDDFIISDNEELTDQSVSILDQAMTNRRLIAFGGKMKEVHKLLNLDDAENGDLINTDQDQIENEELDYILEKYRWDIGYKQYIKISH